MKMGRMNWPVLIVYQLPVIVVFGLFAVNRYFHRSEFATWQWAFDLIVVVTSASRTLTWFLPLSGHTFFLTYAIGTCSSWVVRAIASIVLFEAIAIKHFWLHDDSTVWAGIAIGIVSILIRGCVKTLIRA
jgi:hypothetical protein